jgi:hypothetical protein
MMGFAVVVLLVFGDAHEADAGFAVAVGGEMDGHGGSEGVGNRE